ncbi:MAG: phenylalanine--tRNA ligase subunit alpha [Fervidicoccaceae archaeon]
MEKATLTEGERKLLAVLINLGKDVEVNFLSELTGFPSSTVNALIELLKSKGLIREEVSYTLNYRLTNEGKEALENGLPEEKLTSVLLNSGPLSIPELENRLGRKLLQIALGAARKRGVVEVKEGKAYLVKERLNEITIDREVLKRIGRGEALEKELESRLETLMRRGLIEKELRKVRKVRAEMPAAKTAIETQSEVLVKMTSQDLTSGRWREAYIKEYNVEALPPRQYPGIPSFYMLFIERIKDILKSLGFREVVGPIVETEFWNFDVLFQAQDHPSREIHDTFWIDLDNENLYADKNLVERARTVHESGGKSGSKGWRYKWKQENAARLILRTQMTAVSARTLASKPEPPFRFFSIGKVFRPDLIDSRHLPEFYQLDAIIGDRDMNFSFLLGAIVEFFEEMGLKEVRFKPAYFPFTEPSVEGYIKIEPLGWVEVFGAGLFRPEVLEILDVNVPVGAWGMGLDRLAMALLNIDDIRKLYSRDVLLLREALSKRIESLI